MGLIKASLRTIKRRRSRAILTVICIIIGVAVYSGANVGADGVENSYVTQLLSTFGDVDLTLANGTGPIYFTNYNQSFFNEILSVPHIEDLAPRISRFQTFWFNSTGDNTMLLIGIDPELDRPFGGISPSGLIDQLVDNSCIINQVAADQFNLTGGQNISLYTPFPPMNETIHIIAVGAFQGKFSVEKSVPILVMNIKFVQDISGIGDQASEIVVKIDNYRNIAPVTESLRQIYGDRLSYYSQKSEALERSESNILVLRGALNIFSILALVVTFVLIIVVMLMNISERKRDLGIMRSIGASTRQIFSYVLFETLLYGLTGSIIGTLIGILISTYMLQFLGAAIATITNLGELLLVINPVTLAFSFSLGVFIVLLAGNIPALIASRITILETMRPRMKGLSSKHISRRGLTSGLLLIILGSASMFILSGTILLTGNFTPILMATVLITVGLILFFASTLYYVSKTLSGAFKPVLAESKTVIERNVARNRTRTTFMFTMVTIGIVFVIFFSSLAVTFTSTFSTVIRVFTGSDIKMQTNPAVNYNFTSQIGAIPGIQASTPSYESWCTVTGQEFKVALIFTDTSNFLEVFPRINTANGPPIEEALTTLGATDKAIIISKKVTDKMGLSVGDSITLNVENSLGVVTPIEFKIIAVVEQFYGYPQYMFNLRAYGDIYGAYIDISQLEAIIGTSEIDTFFIKIQANQDHIQVKDSLESTLSPQFQSLTVISATEWETQISSIIQQFSNVVYFFLAFSFIVAAIGISIIMIVAVSERKQEIGILKAMGMSKNQIMKLVIGEGVIITMIGLIVGISGGLYLWFLFLNRIVSTASNLFFELPFIVPLNVIVYLVTVGVIIAFIASAYPAYRAMKLEIVDAIRKD